VSLAPPRPSPLTPGFRLDRYELICPIAEGGMASVWIARQTGKHGFHKLVAVKTILPKFAEDPHFQKMFIDEARLAARIEHANVTAILDVGEQNDVTYLVMEYVDGDALSKLHRAAVKRGARIPPGVVLRVVADVCGGLHTAHELRDERGQPLGVVHRDVSPQNVLVSTRGVAKLIDFGIAKAGDRLSGDTNTDQLKGKVQYMAPEQALGHAIDRRADVWAVGAVLYHLLAGKPPFDAGSEVQTLLFLSSGRPPVPLPPGIPAPVSAVVKRALTSAPDGRYATALDLQRAIEQAMLEANLVTTTSGVAAYLAETVGERASKRQESIALGLKAADERDRVAGIMRANTEATTASNPGSRASAVLTASDGPSSATGQTLGAAAMLVPAPERRRSRTFAVVGGVVTLGIAMAIAVVATRATKAPSPAAPVAPAAAHPAPPSAVTALPAPPNVPDAPVASGATSAATASRTPATVDAAASAGARPVLRWVPPPGPAPAAAPKPPATVKTRVNDGF
jgi:serine/threonine-protein kinase